MRAIQSRSFSSSSAAAAASLRRRVVVTGLGLVTPLGTGTQLTWNRLIAGDCGVQSVADDPAFSSVPPLPSRVVARVCDFRPDAWVSARDQATTSTFVHYALSAAQQALDDCKWKPHTEEDRQRAGVAIGCGVGDIAEVYRAGSTFFTEGYKRLSPYFLPRILINMAAGHVSIQHQLRGPNLASATACTTGAHSIGDAFRAIQYGDADFMLAGGTEASINPLSMAGFCRLRALSTRFNDNPSSASRPFDALRDGFVLGEGAAVLALEELSHAQARDARIYAEIRGYGTSADAFHITAPSPNSAGALACMLNALRDSGLTPAEISYINAHATSTPLGDAVENAAFHQLLGDAAKRVCISSTKGALGHALGAAGAIEAVVCTLSVFHNVVPPTLNLTERTAEFDLDYAPLRSIHREVRVAMSNSYGFGGTNASLVFSKYA